MPLETRQNDAPNSSNQAVADFMALPAGIRTMAVFIYIGFRASLIALRDTALSRGLAWCLFQIALFRYYAPQRLVSVIIHAALFLYGQSSWKTTAITIRQLASRDGADDDLISKLFVDASDLMAYAFASLVFRNIITILTLSLRAVLFLLPLLQLLGAAGVMWYATVDNPVQTFCVEVAKIWGSLWPKLRACLAASWRLVGTAIRHCLRLFMKVAGFIVAYRDQKTAIRVSKMKRYKYSKLKHGEIRLLKLSHLLPWSPVRCELVAVPLDKAPAFESISYTWGSQQALKSLILDGKLFKASDRAYDIVHDRASCLVTRYIWIDSICINQQDDDEKTNQVRLMRNIYGSSYHTIVWLGHAPDANDAIGFLAHLRRRMEFDDPVERASRPLMELNIENPCWPALLRLIKHDYWARCWVIQEIAVSKKVIISYGGELITWEHFSSLIQILFSSDPNSVWHISKIYWRNYEPPPIDAGIQIASLGRVRETIHTNQSMDLFDLLIASINSTATDPRDNVFAVQGISTAVASGDVMPDYTLTVQRTFLKTAEYLLKQDSPLRLLHLAGIGFYRTAGLQTSWAPDWSTKRLSRMYWRNSSEWPYCASGTPDEESDMILGHDGRTLTLKGIIVDEIKELGPQFFGASENGVPKTDLFPGLFNHYAESRSLALEGTLTEPYVTGIPLAEAFWRTLVGDMGAPAGSRPADPIFYSYYRALERCIEALFELSGPEMNPMNPRVGVDEQQRLGNVIASYVTDMGRFANVSGPHTRERMFAITRKGYMGMIPPYSRVGDVVCIIPGAQVPFLLRQVDDSSGSRWQLVGESYFHGMMDGEMVRKTCVQQTIELW